MARNQGEAVIWFLQKAFLQPTSFDDDIGYIDKVLWILTGNIGHDRNKDNGIR